MMNKPQNHSKPKEFDYYIQLQRREVIAKKLLAESKIISEESIKILREFEEIDNWDC